VFDPSALKPFQVIHVYYQFQGQAGEYKYFVVVCHENHDGVNYVVCMKATSKTEKYENDKAQMAGCVYYKSKEVSCFPENTAVQPDNPIPIAHGYLIEQEKNGRFKDKGKLPADFPAKLIAAIRASQTIPTIRKGNLLEKLGEKL